MHEVSSLKVGIIFAVFMILLAIPTCMLFQLGMSGPVWNWNESGNILTDWSVYYLVWIPGWVVVSIVALTGKLTIYRLARFVAMFALMYWLFYDWAWWAITAIVKPGEFSWFDVFYFSILVKPTSMWLFFLVAVLGFVLAIVLVKVVKMGKQLVPFILYLFLVYAPGGIDLVIPQEASFFYACDAVLVVAIAVAAAFTLPRRVAMQQWPPREERVEKIKQW